MPDTCGNRPAAAGSRDSPFSIASRSVAALDFEHHQVIAERQLGQDVAAGDRRARRIDLAAADAAAVHDRDVGAGRARAWRRRSDCRSRPRGRARWRCGCRARPRWWRAARPSRGSAPARSPPPTAATSGSGVTVAVSTTRNCGHQSTSRRLPCCFDLDVQVDHRHVVRVVGRLDHGGAAVEIDEQVVVVAGQDQIGGAGLDQIKRLARGRRASPRPRDRRRRAATPRPAAFMVATVGRNFRSSGFDMRGVPSCAAPVRPMRTPSKLTMSRSLNPGERLAVRRRACWRRTAETSPPPCA